MDSAARNGVVRKQTGMDSVARNGDVRKQTAMGLVARNGKGTSLLVPNAAV
jgi:hypothetical protein